MSKELEAAVSAAIKGSTVGEDGKTTYEKDVSEEIAYMAGLEKRRRDTQASLQVATKRGDKYKAENGLLAESWEADVSKNLTTEQRGELEELKNTDAEAWREKLNKYEQANKASVADKRKKISDDASKETELQSRERLLKEHNEANPKLALTDEVIENDLPPRITKKIAEGKITFAEFIDEAGVYLGKPKKVGGGETAPDEPDLSDSGGSDTPTDTAVDADAAASYANEIY